jgi:hypothetical protein
MNSHITTENQTYRFNETTWLPLPPSAKPCPRSGLKRSHVLKLIRRYPDQIRAANIREPGKLKGRWLIHWESLNTFLQAEAQATLKELAAK